MIHECHTHTHTHTVNLPSLLPSLPSTANLSSLHSSSPFSPIPLLSCSYPSPLRSASLLCPHRIFDLLSLLCRCTIHYKSILKMGCFETSWATQMFCHKMPFNFSLSNFSQFKNHKEGLWWEVGHCRSLTSVKWSVQGLCSHTSHSHVSSWIQRETVTEQERQWDKVTSERRKGYRKRWEGSGVIELSISPPSNSAGCS